MILRPSTPRLRLVGALAVAALVGACSERPSKAPADASSDADANADAEADAGAAPDIGGGDGSDDAGWQPTCPGGIGCACDDPTDCDASLCLETAAGLRCSNFCGDGVCPPGWACEGSKGGVDSLYFCVHGRGLMCRPCTTDTECQASGHAGARCVSYGDAGGFCGVGCQGDGDCQAGHACRDVTSVQGGSTSKQCVVAGKAPATLGACTCSKHAIDKSLQTTCFVQTGAGATDFMHLFGLVALGYMWARIVAAANEKLASGGGGDAERYKAKLITARFFMERLLPETGAYLARIQAGAESTMAMPADAF